MFIDFRIMKMWEENIFFLRGEKMIMNHDTLIHLYILGCPPSQ